MPTLELPRGTLAFLTGAYGSIAGALPLPPRALATLPLGLPACISEGESCSLPNPLFIALLFVADALLPEGGNLG